MKRYQLMAAAREFRTFRQLETIRDTFQLYAFDVVVKDNAGAKVDFPLSPDELANVARIAARNEINKRLKKSAKALDKFGVELK